MEKIDEETKKKLLDLKPYILWEIHEERKHTIPMEERDMELVDSFFWISYDDLYASKILYRKKYYPQAIFYLQQSVEKISKSLLVLMGMCRNEQELKSKIGHEFTVFIFGKLRELIPAWSKYFGIKEYEEMLPHIDKYISKYKQEVKGKAELRIEYKTLVEILEFFPKIIKNFEKGIKVSTNKGIYKKVKQIYIKNIDVLIEQFNDLIPEEISINNKQEYQKNLIRYLEEEEDINQHIRTIFNLIILFVYLTILNINLEGHVILSRYYSYADSFYNKEADIVKIYLPIFRVVKKIHKIYAKTLDSCTIKLI